MIDTHSHIYSADFDEPGSPLAGQCAAVDRAIGKGVNHLIFPNIDILSIGQMKALAAARPDVISMAMGLHPTEVKEDWAEILKAVKAEMESGTHYVAVGEIGIDLYWDRKYEDAQMKTFDEQLSWADNYKLPVIIHCRDGLDRVLEVMAGHPDCRAVFHSFGGTVSDVERIRRHGDHYFGINGIVTFKNSKLREVLPAIGPERILTETDSPYLAPAPYRGKRNESSYLPLIIDTIAQALDLDRAEAESITETNAKQFFSI